LGEVNASVEESPHGELSRLSKTRAPSQGHLDNVPQNHGRAVSGDFDDVVGSVGMRLGEIADKDFVDAGGHRRALLGLDGSKTRPHTSTAGFYEFPEDSPSRFKIMFQAKHRLGNGARFRASEADDTDSTATWRSGDGDDSVVEVHGEIVAGEALSTREIPHPAELRRVSE
jgi:hypothetical protein